MIGNYSLYDFCHLNGQIARRMRDEHFSRYHLNRQEEAEEFTSALKKLLYSFGQEMICYYEQIALPGHRTAQ